MKYVDSLTSYPRLKDRILTPTGNPPGNFVLFLGYRLYRHQLLFLPAAQPSTHPGKTAQSTLCTQQSLVTDRSLQLFNQYSTADDLQHWTGVKSHVGLKPVLTFCF